MAYLYTYIYTVLFLNIVFLQTNSQDIYDDEYENIELDNYDNLTSEFNDYSNINLTCIKCLFKSQQCINNTCVCSPGYYPSGNDTCVKCHAHGEICTPCCAVNLKCIDDFCQYPNANLLKYVSSLALGIALILGVTAIGTIVWKLCFSSHCTENERYRRNSTSSISSVNSIQRLVETRLRDRPPTYSDVLTARRNEFRRALQRVEPPPPYSLFCSDGYGNIYHISDNLTFSNKDEALNVPTILECSTNSEENNQEIDVASANMPTDQTNMAIVSASDNVPHTKEVINPSTVDTVNCTIHI